MKSKINKREHRYIELHQNVKYLSFKDHLQNVKRQPTEGEEIFANHLPDKGLGSKIHKLLQVNNKKINHTFKK